MSKSFRNLIILLAFSAILSPELIEAGPAFGRGKPKAECDGWLVVNAGWLQRVAGNKGSNQDSRFLLNGELGLMRNITETQAVGGSFYLAGDDDGADYGVMARYKKFIDKKSGYDLCAGILFAGDDNYLEKNYPGFIFQASITWRDWIGLMFQAQVVSYDRINYSYDDYYQPAFESYSGTQTEFFLGLRFGSYAALAIPVVIGVIVAATFDDFEFNLSGN